ncbi:MAG: polysaccharide deacetylase family protein [Caulobacteraceae bacterium]|nr:polysaccharide deacetylase family protein [Caulobacteraceae bacterium]
MSSPDEYQVDRSLKGKLRRRLVRLAERRPAKVALERAMVSFAFDDVPISALTHGAPMLEARDLRGTFFVSAGLAGQSGAMGRYATSADWKSLVAEGHELACHTYSHLDCGTASEAAIIADIERNQEAIADWGGGRFSTFAYPYGDVSLAAKRAVGRRFALARGVHRGLITTGVDLNQAPAVGIEGPAGGIHARRWLEYAVSRKAWVIFFTHDVSDAPSPMGCTPDVFREVVDRARSFRCDIVTVAEGARRLGAAAPIQSSGEHA